MTARQLARLEFRAREHQDPDLRALLDAYRRAVPVANVEEMRANLAAVRAHYREERE